MPTKAVVLARSARIAPEPERVAGRFVCDLPVAPALMPLANRPLVRHAFDWLEDAGITQVALVTEAGLGCEMRQAVGDGSCWSFELGFLEQAPGERLGETFEALTCFLDGDPFVLHLADSLAGAPLRSLMGDDALFGHEGLMVVRRADHGDHEKIVELHARHGRRRRAPESTALHGRSSAGVFVLGGALAQAAAAADGPSGRELEDLARRVIELGGLVHTREVSDWWRLGPGPEAFLAGNRFALGALAPDYDSAILLDSRVEGPASIHPSALIESSIVRGPAVIGPGASLRDAYVGPYTSIGREVAIEGAEVENSIVLPRASIRHLGGRLEASVVGPGARIFRDFRLPKALRLNIGEGAEVSLA
jgi:glucose-1-phosphate thymidylyltransferase